jgi:membrane protease YdiL (CAAX protease family)
MTDDASGCLPSQPGDDAVPAGRDDATSVVGPPLSASHTAGGTDNRRTSARRVEAGSRADEVIWATDQTAGSDVDRPRAPAGASSGPATGAPSNAVDPTDVFGAPPGDAIRARRRMVTEIWIVLGLSLGQSAVYSIISLAAKLTAGRPLAQQTSTLNASRATREYVDLAYQIAGIVFALVPVALALWLLSEGGRSAVRRIGFDRTQPFRDLAFGAGLAALIGLPGLGLYAIGRALDLTTTIVPAALNAHWWTVPVLILAAVKNAVLEEVIAVGYLMTRLEALGWPAWAQTGASAVLRGSYHLYQGIGPFLGNALMGVVFAEWFRRKGRVMPLVVAHTILDVVAFVGYELLGEVLGLK